MPRRFQTGLLLLLLTIALATGCLKGRPAKPPAPEPWNHRSIDLGAPVRAIGQADGVLFALVGDQPDRELLKLDPTGAILWRVPVDHDWIHRVSKDGSAVLLAELWTITLRDGAPGLKSLSSPSIPPGSAMTAAEFS